MNFFDYGLLYLAPAQTSHHTARYTLDRRERATGNICDTSEGKRRNSQTTLHTAHCTHTGLERGHQPNYPKRQPILESNKIFRYSIKVIDIRSVSSRIMLHLDMYSIQGNRHCRMADGGTDYKIALGILV